MQLDGSYVQRVYFVFVDAGAHAAEGGVAAAAEGSEVAGMVDETGSEGPDAGVSRKRSRSSAKAAEGGKRKSKHRNVKT